MIDSMKQPIRAGRRSWELYASGFHVCCVSDDTALDLMYMLKRSRSMLTILLIQFDSIQS